MKKYPLLQLNKNKLTYNVSSIVNRCSNFNISVAGVIKGANGMDDVIDCFIKGNVKQIASSRFEQLKKVKEINNTIPTMMIRIPMLSEVEEIIKYCDYSVNSEIKVLEKLNEEAKKQNKKHKVIIMADLGDLREGYIDYDELVNVSLYVEKNLNNLVLSGIGTNLGCYGSIKPDINNLTKLGEIANSIEEKINRELEIVSGGATSSIPLVYNKTIPSKINHLRIGEAILLNMDLPELWDVETGLNNDAFILKAEIIEKKDKPSYPIGEIFIDAFGNRPTYTDIGIRTKVLLGIGKQDIGDFDKLIPLDDRIKLIGASSDHLIADITDCKDDYDIGDVIEFKLYYQALLFSSQSEYVKKESV
mgnify:FL=1